MNSIYAMFLAMIISLNMAQSITAPVSVDMTASLNRQGLEILLEDAGAGEAAAPVLQTAEDILNVLRIHGSMSEDMKTDLSVMANDRELASFRMEYTPEGELIASDLLEGMVLKLPVVTGDETDFSSYMTRQDPAEKCGILTGALERMAEGLRAYAAEWENGEYTVEEQFTFTRKADISLTEQEYALLYYQIQYDLFIPGKLSWVSGRDQEDLLSALDRAMKGGMASTADEFERTVTLWENDSGEWYVSVDETEIWWPRTYDTIPEEYSWDDLEMDEENKELSELFEMIQQLVESYSGEEEADEEESEYVKEHHFAFGFSGGLWHLRESYLNPDTFGNQIFSADFSPDGLIRFSDECLDSSTWVDGEWVVSGRSLQMSWFGEEKTMNAEFMQKQIGVEFTGLQGENGLEYTIILSIPNSSGDRIPVAEIRITQLGGSEEIPETAFSFEGLTVVPLEDLYSDSSSLLSDALEQSLPGLIRNLAEELPDGSAQILRLLASRLLAEYGR